MPINKNLTYDVEIVLDHLSVCILILNRYPKGAAHALVSHALNVIETLGENHLDSDQAALTDQTVSTDQAMKYQNQLTILQGEFLKTENKFAAALVEQLIDEIQVDLLVGEVPDTPLN